jgi:beta-phosphoglucomutase-like phosphatase (HAD superfamily)
MIPQSRVHTLIFNYDGVIATTEEMHWQSWAEILELLGVHVHRGWCCHQAAHAYLKNDEVAKRSAFSLYWWVANATEKLRIQRMVINIEQHSSKVLRHAVSVRTLTPAKNYGVPGFA